MSVRLGIFGLVSVSHDRALPAVIVQLEGRGPGLHHGGDGREAGLVHRDRGFENGGVVLTAGHESRAPGNFVQVVVVALAIEIEQGVTRRDAAVAMCGESGADGGIFLFGVVQRRGFRARKVGRVCRDRARPDSLCRLSGPSKGGVAIRQVLRTLHICGVVRPILAALGNNVTAKRQSSGETL